MTPELSVQVWEVDTAQLHFLTLQYFSKGKVAISLDDIVDALNLLQKGSLETRWRICSEICDFDRQEKLSSTQLALALNLILEYASSSWYPSSILGPMMRIFQWFPHKTLYQCFMTN